MVELVVGACLVLGLLTRVAGGVSALLQVAFIIGIASVWARGISINCGCFGDGGPNPDAIGHLPLGDRPRRGSAPALTCSSSGVRRTPFALDNLLYAARTEGRDVEEAT